MAIIISLSNAMGYRRTVTANEKNGIWYVWISCFVDWTHWDKLINFMYINFKYGFATCINAILQLTPAVVCADMHIKIRYILINIDWNIEDWSSCCHWRGLRHILSQCYLLKWINMSTITVGNPIRLSKHLAGLTGMRTENDFTSYCQLSPDKQVKQSLYTIYIYMYIYG